MVRNQKSSLPMTLFGVAIMIAAVLIVLFSGASGITASNIESHLQHFGEFAAKEASESGRQAKFTYGDIHVEGLGYAKRGTINNVILEVKSAATKWTFTTPAVLVQPDPTTPSRLFFIFAAPIEVMEDDKPATTIAFASPLKYSYFNGRYSKTPTILHSLYLPEKITLTAAGAAVPHTTIVYDQRPVAEARFLPETHERNFVYAFRNLKITTEDSETIMKSISSDFNEAQDAENHVNGRYMLTIDDLAIKSAERISKPYSISADLNYNGDMPPPETSGMGNIQIAVNKVALMGNDFKVLASGNVALAVDDPLPAGKVDVTMENVGKFLESDLVPDSLRPTVAEALQKITGQPAEAATNAVFVLKREKNGVFYVGNTTFEALTAAMLSGLLQLPDLAPSSPPAEESPATVEPPLPESTTPPPVTAPSM
jgi:hypothetical protein